MNAALFLAAAAAAAQPADLVLVNGRVYTLDANRPWAEGLAIAGDRIAAVGTALDVPKHESVLTVVGGKIVYDAGVLGPAAPRP